jgi:hypothetical protein
MVQALPGMGPDRDGNWENVQKRLKMGKFISSEKGWELAVSQQQVKEKEKECA